VKHKLPSRLIFIGFFVGIACWYGWGIIQNGRYLEWLVWLPIFSWLLGGFIGFWFLYLDRLIDIYFTHPETQLSHYIRHYLSQGRYQWAWKTLQQRRKEQQRLTFHSALFQVVWVILALFTLSSTSSLLGKGLVMGLGLHLLLNQWQDYLIDPQYLRGWLFWQIKREISLKEQKIYLLLMLFLFLVLTGMIL